MLFKKFAIITVFPLLLLMFLAKPMDAHVLKSDGSIGAVIHINPDDDPIVGEESSFFFEFKDKNGEFTPKNCNCIVTILQSGKEIHTQPLFTNNTNPSLTNASFTYTFPTRDIYTIQVTGTPTTRGAFENFTLTYDIRVERVSDTTQSESEKPTSYTTYLPLLVGGILVVIVLMVVIRQRNKRR